MASITGASAKFLLTIAGLFPAPQQLQGFAADDVFSTEPVNIAELVMGVDGRLSAGFVHVLRPMNVHIMPDSPSSSIFDAWYSANQAAQDVYFANGIVTLPTIKTNYVLTNGVLTSYSPIPAVKKVLQARQFTITWESIVPVPG